MMRADPNDRIILTEAPAVSPVSVPRIFAVGLVLPFAHPIRLLLASLLPVALIVGLGLGPIGRILQDVATIGVPLPGGGGMVATVPPPQFGFDIVKLEGILFLALAVWLCAWQRARASGFHEPILRWLGGSLRKFPGYIFALAFWLLAPSIVPIGALGALISRTIGSTPATAPQESVARMHAIGEMFSPLQWWVIGIAMLAIALLALWLSARLSPLPALVAGRGWRGAFGRAWWLSRGHGFGLSAALLAYWLFSMLVLIIGGIAFGMVMFMRAPGSPLFDARSGPIFGSVADVGVTALIALWQASLGALVVRDGQSPAKAVDPAMFD